MKPENITAWALEEASTEERQQLEEILQQNPQARREAENTKEFCDFLLTELRDESMALTDEQRERLEGISNRPSEVIFGEPAPVQNARTPMWFVRKRVLPMAALISVGFFVWAYREANPGKLVASNSVNESQRRQPRKESLAAPDEFKVQFGQTQKVTREVEKLAKSPPSAPLNGALAQTAPLAMPGVLPASSSASPAGDALASVMKASEQPIALPPASPVIVTSRTEPIKIGAGTVVITAGTTLATDYTPPLRVLADNVTRTQELLPEVQELRPYDKLQRDSKNESYTRIVENQLTDVQREPLSTLSIDVDTAAYANVRRFLNQNMAPPVDAVRIEELINYFPTNDEGPVATAKEPFAVNVEMAACPWQPKHQLARIAIKGREIEKGTKASNLVFLVDVSGSMSDALKLPLVQQSLRMLAEQMGEGDRVSLVTYASGSGVVLPSTNGEKRAEIIAAIDQLRAGGSTNGAGGIQLAYEQAVGGFIKDGINRVILCTDGDFNVGISAPEELEKLITEKARSGVFLSVLGFGSGNLKDRTMETLADKGNGNYAYIDSLSEARKVLVEQMSGTLVTIAKDVKIQVEFNPTAVRSYRLIGYENRILAKEDFNDDRKDAGEIGSGHSVIALYEVVPANLPPGTEPTPLVDNLKYQTAIVNPTRLGVGSSQDEMMTVKLRYKLPDGDVSEKIEVPVKNPGMKPAPSTKEFRFSAAVAAFGLLLRDSSYKGALTWDAVRNLALEGKGADKLGYRGEFLQLIDKARSVKGGK